MKTINDIAKRLRQECMKIYGVDEEAVQEMIRRVIGGKIRTLKHIDQIMDAYDIRLSIQTDKEAEQADEKMVEDVMRSMTISDIESIIGEDMMEEIGSLYCRRCIERDASDHIRRKEM